MSVEKENTRLLANNTDVENNRGKVIFLGNAGAGKSTTKKHLFGDAYGDGNWDNTAVFNGTNLSLWDFGGQEVYSSLQPLFLTDNALYLVVVNLAKFETNTQEEKPKFTSWMDSLRLYAPKSPVIIIGTFTDMLTHPETLQNFDAFVKEQLSSSTQHVHFNGESSFFPLTNVVADSKVGGRKKTPLSSDVDQDDNNVSRIQGAIRDLSSKENQNSFSEIIHLRYHSSWLDFMVHIRKSGQEYVWMKKLREEAVNFNMGDELEEMINFFKNSGAILFFDKLDKDHYKGDNLVVLDPHWLLKTFTGLIFDSEVDIQSKKNLMKSMADKKNLNQLVATGMLSKSFMAVLLPDLDKATLNYLVAIGMHLMLFTDIFHPDYMNLEILIPCMLPKRKRPSPDETKYHISVDFELTLPTGYFSRLVAYIIQGAVRFGSKSKPILYEKFGSFLISHHWAFDCVQTKDNKKILLFIQPQSMKYAAQIFEFLQEAIRSIFERTGTKIEYDTYVQAAGKVASLKDVTQAIYFDLAKLRDVDDELVDVAAFRVFYLQPERPVEEFDCYLSHCWGEKGQTHAIVKGIYDTLKKQNVTCWLDEVYMRGNIFQSLAEGLDRSKKYAIFVTRTLMERIENPRSNVSKEFSFMVRGTKQVVLVILEPQLLDTNTWSPFLQFSTGVNRIMIDMTSEAKIMENVSKLRDQIMG